MDDNAEHFGGCLCGEVRYKALGQPKVKGVCHCRYCQLRSGSAFGVLAYFLEENFLITAGTLGSYNFKSESDNSWNNEFCQNCGTTILSRLEVFPGMVGIMGGTFDPPTFWYDLDAEVFVRSKAHFVGGIEALKHEDTFFSHDPKRAESKRLEGSEMTS
ncbi:GFA family protein [Gammaproteobacteria bacterium]|jgi:hypothetical protein|nr:GFA family protein [Gammaproteobacteria bacterium]|tara:strand:- start:92 stop:568 length:477 start_codon:yes stop_codon:yes gene_type:complete